ncbi:MAG: glycerol-3-phosphate dehydrogenase [Firmicutes bacterium]|nr:glycerol-3-phosphate dehydrogenase [Bacillota bacterium]
MKISVLGCGRWGSFLAWYCSRLGYNTFLWGMKDSSTFKELVENNGKNNFVQLPNTVHLIDDIELALQRSDIAIISIPTQQLRVFLNSSVVNLLQDKKVVLCMKGIECSTGKRLTEVAIDCGLKKDNLAVWVGPGHIQEFVKNKPNAMVIDSCNKNLTKFLVENFKSNLIRLYYGEDLIGTEVGAACKNIMGILAGMLDGADMSALKGPLMSRGAREVGRLIKAMGGNDISAYGLCHLGDYETTLFSQHSNNRKWGENWVLGKQFDKLAEGVPTTTAVVKIVKDLPEDLCIDMPLTFGLKSSLDRGSPDGLLEELFGRPTGTEFYKKKRVDDIV